MKKIIALLALTMISCADYTTSTDGKSPQRIHGKEYSVFAGSGYQIIEIDGVECVSSTIGGICPLVKQNKNE